MVEAARQHDHRRWWSRWRWASPAGRDGAGTRRSQAAQASALYETLAKAVQANDAKALRDAAGTLVENYPRTLYASLGALVAARFYFDRNDLKSGQGAAAMGDRARADARTSSDLARLRLAAVLLDEKAYDEALKLLEAKHARRLRRAVRRAARRRAGREEPGRGRESGLQARARKGRRRGQRVPRKRAHAARRARRLMRIPALVAAALAAAACQLAERPQAGRAAARSSRRRRCACCGPRASAARTASCSFRRWWATRCSPRRATAPWSGSMRCQRAAERWRVTLEQQLSARRGRRASSTVVVATEDGDVFALDGCRRQAALARARLERGARRRRRWQRPGAGAQRRQPHLRLRRAGRKAPLGVPARARLARSCAVPRASPSWATPPMPASPAASSPRSRFPTARVRWEATVALPKGATELERVTDVVGEPVVQGREVCAAAYQGRVACFEMANGRQVWSRELSSLTGVSARRALCLRQRRPRQRARARPQQRPLGLEAGQARLPPAFDAARRWATLVAVGDFEGYVHFLSRDTGAFVARYSTRRRRGARGAARPCRRACSSRPRTERWSRSRCEAGDRARRPPERRQVDPLQPPHPQPRRDRARPARRDARPALRRRPHGRARLHRHRHRRLRAAARRRASTSRWRARPSRRSPRPTRWSSSSTRAPASRGGDRDIAARAAPAQPARLRSP